MTSTPSLPFEGHCILNAFVESAGRIDGQVNNAGGGRAQPFRSLTVDGWEQTLRLNLEAAMMASQAAYVRMRKQKSSGIVNMASISFHVIVTGPSISAWTSWFSALAAPTPSWFLPW